MSFEARNITAELRAEESRNASNRHITSITLSEKRSVITNAGICESFETSFRFCLPRSSVWALLSSTPIWPSFLGPKAAKAAKCKFSSQSLRSAKRWIWLAWQNSGIRWFFLWSAIEVIARSCYLAETDLQQLEYAGCLCLHQYHQLTTQSFLRKNKNCGRG